MRLNYRNFYRNEVSENFAMTYTMRKKNFALSLFLLIEDASNRYIQKYCLPAFNKEFTVKAAEAGTAFIDYRRNDLLEILCERYERVVGKDNCVQFEGIILQIPVNKYRMNYVRVKVEVRRYWNQCLGVYHGPRLLALYNALGELLKKECAAA